MVNKDIYIKKYNTKVKTNAYKYEAKADKIPDLYVSGLKSKFGKEPRAEIVKSLREMVDIMKKNYKSYAENPNGDKWWENWTLAVFGETL